MRILRESIRCIVIVLTLIFGAAAVVLLTVVGAPIALLVFLGLCPFATIRWAFVGDETWLESWKRVAKDWGGT